MTCQSFNMAVNNTDYRGTFFYTDLIYTYYQTMSKLEHVDEIKIKKMSNGLITIKYTFNVSHRIKNAYHYWKKLVCSFTNTLYALTYF